MGQALAPAWLRLKPDRRHRDPLRTEAPSSGGEPWPCRHRADRLRGLRIYRDYPALDRSDDRRPATVLSALTAGLDDRRAMLLTDLNWQVQNGLTYYASARTAELATRGCPTSCSMRPALVRDNLAIGRDVC